MYPKKNAIIDVHTVVNTVTGTPDALFELFVNVAYGIINLHISY